ncbi:RWD domain-containing protein [Microdochium trichocladiopsis]|uniref:RBR-type E3 ubiquitin transferase n=1 Tax=Microdochium trichocladiopsis TaxID=1682393 RepID=A0A9P8Y9A4_9PEZI|nr:RWD domain-containing protein [Microdochium trichocladiopsis]KAH7032926.1 RWD domain-containing protein [Microdochium trichocladiopsis]
MDDDDPRTLELETITAIYPELQVDDKDQFTVSIDIPVSLDNPLTVFFPASGVGAPIGTTSHAPEASSSVAVDSQALSNLPPLQVKITLPPGYPQDKPPAAKVSTTPPWLAPGILRKLEHDAERLWEEIGHDQVIFTYIDDLQQSTADIFGLVSEKGTLEVSPEHKIAILDYDSAAKRRAFERETFDCGICLEPKKGSACHKMLDCGHVFCVQCLQDFYNNAITEGDIAAVQCLEPSCAKERGTAQMQAANATKKKKPKTFISPSELLQIPLETEMVKRYVKLKHKTELESDKNTVYCPRSWCQGAARSKKHRKPEGLEFSNQSDDESETEETTGTAKNKTAADYRNDLLAICEDCGFAFCSRCGQSWHGEFKYCIPKERKEAITEEEKASLEYVKMHTTPCPTCAAPAQKTQGCNHMLCFRCQTHFCYLCSSWLDPSNPYGHFNTQADGKVNSCYMRLWELEGGDGQDVGIGYAGGNALNVPNGEPALEPHEVAALMEAEERIVGDRPAANILPAINDVQGNQAQRAPQERVEVAREGPLVLRIGGDAPGAAPRNAFGAEPAAHLGPARIQHGGRGAAPPAQRGVGRGRGRGPERGNRGNNRGGGAVGGGAINANRQQAGAAGRGRGRHARNQPRGANDQAAANREPHMEIGNILRQQGELDEAQQAWIRQFVQLALNDQEDLVDWDSGDEI